MPTGYTTPIFDRPEGITFNEYAKRCARAFGACADMRDESMDTPPPKRVDPEPEAFYLEYLTQSKAALAAFLAKTDDELRATMVAEYDRRDADHAKYAAGDAEMAKRAAEMLDAITAWTPPSTEHADLKKFMREQITDYAYEFTPGTPHKVEREPFDVWKRKQLRSLMEDVEMRVTEVDRQREQRRKKNEWLRAFYESIGEWP